jgi:hypothetical protein
LASYTIKKISAQKKDMISMPSLSPTKVTP